MGGVNAETRGDPRRREQVAGGDYEVAAIEQGTSNWQICNATASPCAMETWSSSSNRGLRILSRTTPSANRDLTPSFDWHLADHPH